MKKKLPNRVRYLEDVMLNRRICEQVLELALSRGGEFAELYCEDGRSFSMVLRSGRIENAGYSRPYGAGLRVYDGTRSIYMFTSDTSDRYLNSITMTTSEKTPIWLELKKYASEFGKKYFCKTWRNINN